MGTRGAAGARSTRAGTQRERLIASMVAVVHRHGYGGANVSRVIAGAGVSRPTFYEHFRDREDCFLETHRELGRSLVSEVAQAVAAQAPERAPQAAVGRAVQLAQAHPERAWLLAGEALAAGRRALDEHDRLVAELARIVEGALEQAPARARAPDLPIVAAIGATRWMLAPALRRGERDLSKLGQELEGWLEAYERPLRGHRWRTLDPGPELERSMHVTALPLRAHAPLPRGRPRLTAGEVASNQRERIMLATAEAAVRKGYAATRVADITAAAKVDRRVFYTHFRDKQQAFLAVHELGIQHTLQIAAAAFFSAGDWPRRVWEAMKASAQFEAESPVITHLGHVESHAVGAPAIQRIDDTRAAFTIFLQEGAQLSARAPTHTAMEAIGGGVFEIGYLQVRQGRPDLIARMVPPAAHLALTPFMGVQQASKFIDARVREQARWGASCSPATS